MRTPQKTAQTRAAHYGTVREGKFRNAADHLWVNTTKSLGAFLQRNCVHLAGVFGVAGEKNYNGSTELIQSCFRSCGAGGMLIPGFRF